MLDVKNFVAVSGFSGIFKLITVRNNGLVVENFDTKERKLMPSRQHQFSPLETVSVYTEGDSTPIAVVFTNMYEKLEAHPLPSDKASSAELRAYFTAVLPEHDRDLVHISDIKKIVKWFNYLHSRNLLQEAAVEATEETTATTED